MNASTSNQLMTQRFSRRAALMRSMSGPLIGLIALCVFFSLKTDAFFSAGNLLNILDQITVLGILAVGMTLVIVTGGIDLSVGSVLAFSMMVMGVCSRTLGLPFELSMLAAALAGALCGALSGSLVVWARLPPFIATLAVMSAARGMANILTEGRQIVGYPEWFTQLATVRQFGFLSLTVAGFILIALIAALILRYRPVGRNLFAIGGNAQVARLVGIRVNTSTLMVYVISGLMAGIAAVTFAARLDSSQPSAGQGYELDTIAAVVVGGASLSGGVGSIGGTVIGVFIIGVLRNGLNLMGVSPFVQQVLIGVVIAIAVMFDTLGRRKR